MKTDTTYTLYLKNEHGDDTIVARAVSIVKAIQLAVAYDGTAHSGLVPAI